MWTIRKVMGEGGSRKGKQKKKIGAKRKAKKNTFKIPQQQFFCKDPPLRNTGLII
jgi:hypothetical protein